MATLIYEILTSETPFDFLKKSDVLDILDEDNKKVVLKKMDKLEEYKKKGVLPFGSNFNDYKLNPCSPNLKIVLVDCWSVTPDQRPSIQQLTEVMEEERNKSESVLK